MKIINLRDFYPHYTTDVFVHVPDEVADLLFTLKLKEAADQLRVYRHKAYFSLDADDGTELRALSLIYQQPLDELIDERQLKKLLYRGLATLPEKQRQRIYAHFFLGISKADIAKAEGCHVNSVKESIHRGLATLKKFFEKFA